MDQRQHPRVTVPLVVELTQATLGTREATARDLSDGGVFIHLVEHTLRVGASLKIKLKSTSLSDTQNTPTVDAQVVRVDADGIAVSFKNKTAHHLWSSVERLRSELTIGRDYFQVYEALVCLHGEKGVLFTQKHGKWGFPGYFLQVTDKPEKRRSEYLDSQIDISPVADGGTITVETFYNSILPEASTLCVVQRMTTECAIPRLHKRSEFKDFKWVSRAKDLADITVASEWMRKVGGQELRTHGFIDP